MMQGEKVKAEIEKDENKSLADRYRLPRVPESIQVARPVRWASQGYVQNPAALATPSIANLMLLQSSGLSHDLSAW